MYSDSRLCWFEPVVLRQQPRILRDLNDGLKENCQEAHWFAGDRLRVAEPLLVAKESAGCVCGGDFQKLREFDQRGVDTSSE